MIYILGSFGVLVCIGLAMNGYLVPLLIGGVLGSFLGIAGFGGAIAGTIPGAIIGAVIAVAIKSQNGQHAQAPISTAEFGQYVVATGRLVRNSLQGVLSIAILAVLLVWVVSEFLQSREHSFAPAPLAPSAPAKAAPSPAPPEPVMQAPAPRQSFSPPSRNSPQQSAEPTSWSYDAPQEPDYDRVLSQLERRYPEINPDSPYFDQSRTDGIAARVQLYTSQGKSRVAALRAAIRDTYGN